MKAGNPHRNRAQRMNPLTPNMSDEEMRIAVAKACGWTRVEWYEDNAGPPILHGFPPPEITSDNSGDWDIKEQKHSKHIPDFLNDLNAIHEAEKTLTMEQCFKYRDILQDMVLKEVAQKNTDFTFGATARQRCEAFLRTIGGGQ